MADTAAETIFTADAEVGDGAGAGASAGNDERRGRTYTASEKASGNVNELLAQDNEDESLRKYKEQLLGAAAKGDLGGVLFEVFN